MNNSIKLGIALALGHLCFYLCYFGAWNYHFYAVKLINPSFLDMGIPFIEGSILVYLSQYIFLMLALYLTNQNCRLKAFYMMLICMILASLCFIYYPTTNVRPLIPLQGLFSPLWSFLYATDVPGNCFPSLHVALALCAATAFHYSSFLWSTIGKVWAVCIIISTLTTKQHVLLDVLGGVGLYLISLLVITELRKIRWKVVL